MTDINFFAKLLDENLSRNVSPKEKDAFVNMWADMMAGMDSLYEWKTHEELRSLQRKHGLQILDRVLSDIMSVLLDK
jgi:hypothetical protein